MAKPLSLYLFIDALGWSVLQSSYPQFLQSLAPHRKPLKTILGYSSACDPSIISGKLPSEHLHWSCFYYSPKTSPFQGLQWLQWLPGLLRDQHRFRYQVSQLFANIKGYTGYFQLYEVPFQYLKYFDYSEKKWIYGPGGLIQGQTLFDHAHTHQIPYFVSPLFMSDSQSFEQVKQALTRGDIRFAYVLLGQLDALMHHVGTQSPEIKTLLQWYERQIQILVDFAHAHDREVALYLFSDHGMHDVIGSRDLERDITALPLCYGVDYVAMYDSTMARFWYLSSQAQPLIHAQLDKTPHGKRLTDQELQQLGVFFPDRRYGETIFLMNSGQLIAPSYMGKKVIPGMHGYHPNDADSDAVVLSNHAIPETTTAIQHLYSVFMQDLYAHAPLYS
jgi:hypothetical protein